MRDGDGANGSHPPDKWTLKLLQRARLPHTKSQESRRTKTAIMVKIDIDSNSLAHLALGSGKLDLALGSGGWIVGRASTAGISAQLRVQSLM